MTDVNANLQVSAAGVLRPLTTTDLQTADPAAGPGALDGSLQTAITRLNSILLQLQGTLAVSAGALPLPAGAATSSGQSASQPRDVTDRSGRLLGVVSGAVTVGNFPATQPVSLASAPTTPVTGTFFQATQPVSAASLPLPAGAALEATQGKRYSGGKLSVGGTLNTAGDNVILTPAAGKAITVFWVSVLANPDDTASNLFTVKFSDGTVLYTGYAVAHWEPFTAPANATLIVNLAGTQPVSYTAHYTVA